MKKAFLAAFSVISLAAFAQTQIKVDQSRAFMSEGTQSGFLVDIPQTTIKEMENDWLKYTSEGSSGKATVVEGEYLQIAAINKNVSPKPFNVYSKLLETTEGVRLTLWLTEDNIDFMSAELNNDQHLAAQKYVYDFAIQEYTQTVQNELNAELDKQKSLESELTKLINDEEKSTKKINQDERSIERANDAIVTNKDDLQSSSSKIHNQKEMVAYAAADPNAAKGAQKTLTDLENEKKALQRQNEKQGKNIDSRNKEIREEERNTTGYQQDQALKMAEIDKQKLKVQEVQTKLDNIK